MTKRYNPKKWKSFARGMSRLQKITQADFEKTLDAVDWKAKKRRETYYLKTKKGVSK